MRKKEYVLNAVNQATLYSEAAASQFAKFDVKVVKLVSSFRFFLEAIDWFSMS